MSTYNPKTERLLKELNSLIGLKSVKQSIQEIVDLETANQLRKSKGLPLKKQTLHMLFTGNPGTGKTTVARLVGKIFYALGILKKDTFKEVGRDDLVGQYVGHTANKTNKVVKSSLDGVLFIDESYALSRGGRNDFGNEAIDTIVPLMENYRDRLIVILAGYSDEMEDFMEANSGLASRIAYKIEFPDYTGEELFQIFLDMCKKDGWICSENAKEKVRETLIAIYENRDKKFGNGREVRNFYEKMIRQQAKRVVRDNLSTSQELTTFSTEDIPDISEPFLNNDKQPEIESDFESDELPQNISSNPPTSDRPLLLGILADVSLSMIKSINNRDEIVQNRFEGFRSSLHKLVDKAKNICREKSSDNIQPLMKAFLIGFGFGNPLSFIFGDDCTKKVRDLFEISDSSYPTTIPITKLIDDWEIYENHINKLIRNMCGETPMGEAFKIAEERLSSELKNKAYYENPILFILSDGVPTDTDPKEIIDIAKRIKNLGTIIISCYVTDKNITKPNYLYNKPDQKWEQGARLMFDCASIPPSNSAFYGYFNELGWNTNGNSGRLFAQINETQLLEDFLQSVISPLKNFK